MRSFLLALQFLTIVPVRVRGEVAGADMARSAGAFPAVGLLQGAFLACSHALLIRAMGPDVTAALLVLLLVISNGGFHLDGLADTFDGLAAKGGREARLSAMRDSFTGPIGVTAIVAALGLKYLALREAMGAAPGLRYGTLLFMPVVSRWAMVLCIWVGGAARPDGLGNIFIQGVGGREVLRATALAGIAFALCGAMAGPVGWAAFLSSLAVAALLSLGLLRLYFGSFGGLTGDTLGAASEITEVAVLLTVGAWLRLSTS